jgi:shikimate dehydrogenase
MSLENHVIQSKAPNPDDRYCVFGNPIKHSKSPLLHTLFSRQTVQSLVYTAQCVDIDNFSIAATNFFKEGGKGLNVTVPFKHEAYTFASSLTDRAIRAGAVNTLFINEHNIVVGDNTDGIGLVEDITLHLDWRLKDMKILIMGAGGAVRGILEPIINESPHSITIVNRTQEKAQKLADVFSDIFSITVTSYPELNNAEESSDFDIIINASSASLSGELPALPNNIIGTNTYCYDLMYAKELTPFLLWAKAKGSSLVSDGLGMLVCQGAESFLMWRGVKPKTAEVIQQLRILL